MEDKSITELINIICDQNDMIIRKNKFLKNASDRLRDLSRLATMCDGIRFKNTESASEFMSVMANTLRKISYERFDLLQESNIEQPEAVNVADEVDTAPDEELEELEEVTEDDLEFLDEEEK